MRKKFKRIAVDLAGYGLVLLGLLLGWLPGPGGIPLILAGLGLLSVHNHWAKRFLKYLQDNGAKLTEWGFPENRAIQAAHDLFVVVLLIGVLYLLIFQRNYFTIGIVIGLTGLATIDLLYNRSRLKKIKKR